MLAAPLASTARPEARPMGGLLTLLPLLLPRRGPEDMGPDGGPTRRS